MEDDKIDSPERLGQLRTLLSKYRNAVHEVSTTEAAIEEAERAHEAATKLRRAIRDEIGQFFEWPTTAGTDGVLSARVDALNAAYGLLVKFDHVE